MAGSRIAPSPLSRTAYAARAKCRQLKFEKPTNTSPFAFTPIDGYAYHSPFVGVAFGSSIRPPSTNAPLVSRRVHCAAVRSIVAAVRPAGRPIVWVYQILPLRKTTFERINESPESRNRRAAGQLAPIAPAQVCGRMSPPGWVQPPPGRVLKLVS